MIKYNNNTINDWYYGTSNLIKVYRNNAIVFYKVSGESPTPEYKVCFAVVDDITQYQETEFEDVYDKASEKWYKLNNLDEYEEYGIYSSGRTSCEGSTSRLPQGYTEVEYIENTSTAYIDTGVYLYDTTTNSYEIETKISSSWHNSEFEYLIATEGTSSPYNGVELRWSRYYQSGNELQCESVPKNVVYSNIDNGDGTSAVTITCSATQATNNVPLSLFCGIWSTGPWRNGRGKIYSFKVTKNDTLVKDLVPCKRDSDNKYGMYDIVNDVFYLSPNNVDFIGGEPITPTDCVTTYNGKLTIDDGYEYEWNGSSWVSLGEVSGSSRLPVGYTEVEYIQNTGTSYINTDLQIYSSTTNSFEAEAKLIAAKHDSQAYQNVFSCMSEDGEPYQGFVYRYQSSNLVGTSIPNGQNAFTIVNNADSTQTVTVTSSSSQRTYTHTYPLTLFCGLDSSRNPFRWTNSKFYYCKIKMNNELARDFVPCKRDSDNKYGMYDIVNDVFYLSPNNVDFSGGEPITPTEYPKYYTEKSDPLNDLTFNTLAEAQAYAYNNCVYDGMKATIDGTNYIFSGDSQSGYEWIENPSRLPVGYTEVEYIQNYSTTGQTYSNLAYINTNYTPNQNTRTVADMKIDKATTNPRLFGNGRWNSLAYIVSCEHTVGASNGYIYYKYGNTSSWYTTTVHSDLQRHVYELNTDGKLIIDNTEIATLPSTTFTCVYSMGIFTATRTSSDLVDLNETIYGKMYSFKVYESGTLVRDLVPCINPSNVVGAYDLVNDVFYQSANNNPLIAGPSV